MLGLNSFAENGSFQKEDFIFFTPYHFKKKMAYIDNSLNCKHISENQGDSVLDAKRPIEYTAYK